MKMCSNEYIQNPHQSKGGYTALFSDIPKIAYLS